VREHRQQLVLVTERFAPIEKVSGGVEREEHAQDTTRIDFGQIARDWRDLGGLCRSSVDRLRQLFGAVTRAGVATRAGGDAL
jgi:hypothetical protein